MKLTRGPQAPPPATAVVDPSIFGPLNTTELLYPRPSSYLEFPRLAVLAFRPKMADKESKPAADKESKPVEDKDALDVLEAEAKEFDKAGSPGLVRHYPSYIN